MRNKLISFVSSIVKGLLVCFITYLGIIIGGLFLGNLALPEISSDWSIENPMTYVFIVIPLIAIISIVQSQYSKKLSKNSTKQFFYICFIFLSLFSLVDIIGNFVLAKKVVLSSYITLILYNLFPSILGAIGIRAFWKNI